MAPVIRPLDPAFARRARDRIVPALSCVLFVCAAACRATSFDPFDPFDPADAATSPQARAEPAPLASVPALGNAATSLGGADTGPPPVPFGNDRAVEPDVAGDAVREPGAKETPREAREAGGYALQAIVRTGDGPGPPRSAEVNFGVIDSARRKGEARMTIDLGAARARFVFSSGFVVPAGTELRSRIDRFGHLLLWPGEETYRIAEMGALRALLGERRLDVAPLSPAEARAAGDGARRLNVATRRVEVVTRAATAVFELGTLRESGDGGTLVCRFLLDLMGALPAGAACAADEVPLHAELRWSSRGSLVFDVTSLARRADFPAGTLGVPPASLAFVTDPPPAASAELMMPRSELASFRTAPADVPPAPRDAQVPPPDAGLLLVNGGDELHVVWIDGVQAAWVAPGARLALPMLVRGRYAVQWRTALGDSWETPDMIAAPGVSEIGGPR